MIKLMRAFQVLPQSLFVEGIHCENKMYAFGGGGNADIFQGSYKGKMVALKRLRTFIPDPDRDAIHQVCGLLYGVYIY